MRWWLPARARYLAALVADPGLGETAHTLDPALLARLHANVREQLAADFVTPARAWPSPALRWSALAACALLGIWIGWAEAPRPAPTLLAAVQLTPFSDPAP